MVSSMSQWASCMAPSSIFAIATNRRAHGTKKKPLGKKGPAWEVLGLPAKKLVCSTASLAVGHSHFLSNDTRTQLVRTAREFRGEKTVRSSSEW